MGRISTYFTLLACLLIGWQLPAQISCQYTLELYDSFGDGWNGASITVTINGESTDYTIGFADNDGEFLIVPLTISDDDEISLSYFPGTFENEVTYFLYDADGILVFNDGPFPMTGDDIFSFTGSCPTCPAPPPASVSIDDVRHNRAEVSWIPSDPDGDYMLEFGAPGFTQGDGTVVVTTGSEGLIQPLMENTPYEFYLSVACANGDTSTVLGPYPFVTRWANDLGIVDITTPLTACGLSASETVAVTLANFGGLPQQLFPFNFSVNGIPAGVSQPVDGVFAGNLGTDEIYTAEFDLMYDFSEFGEYTISAWTDLMSDSVINNDTFTVTIVNIPVISELPYDIDFEDGAGGWTEVTTSPDFSQWELGEPNSATLTSAASGDFAWVTNPAGNYIDLDNQQVYLVSPCFDFSSLDQDPRLSFSLWFDTESCCDEGWVDVSTDAGGSWTRVGTAGSGQNWYNDGFSQWWDGTGNFSGWVTASNILEGTAGSSDVLIRFGFSSDFSVVREGMGVDDILITPQLSNDLSAVAGNHTETAGCGGPEDQVIVTVTNIGLDAQSGFEVGYSVNGGAPVSETVPGDITLAQGESTDYTFNTTFDSSQPGDYTVTVWSALISDGLLVNDTTEFTFSTALSVPYAEDFEGGTNIPVGWEVDTDIFVANAHNSLTNVMYDNIYSGDQTFQATMPVIGPIEATDTLFFDYRYTDWSAGTVGTELTLDDVLTVLISTDCGETYNVAALINGENHTATGEFTTVAIPLEDFAGDPVKIRFTAQWGAGDYWLDLDNIFIPRCVGTLGLEADVTNASPDTQDGQIVITPTIGITPFTFAWEDGTEADTLANLAPGDYTVSVTDAYGCADQVTVTVDLMVNTDDLVDRFGDIKLAPNPTNGLTTLNVDFTEPVDAQVQVLNMLGQPVWQSAPQNRVLQLNETLDLNEVPAGIYLVRIQANEQSRVLKVVKSE